MILNAEILARLDEIESSVRRLRASLTAPESDALYETAEQFAVRRGKSVFTVRRWCKAGMPHAHPPGGYRIPVRDAVRWLDTDGRVQDIAQAARRSAWGGSK